MSLKRSAYTVVVLLVLVYGAGCRRFINPLTGDKMLARAGDEVLSVSEVKGIFTPGMTPEDSLKLLEKYVDMWVKRQLKIQQAEKLFPESMPDVERMVQEYRGSLLGVKLDNYYTEGKVDTAFSSKEIFDYYTDNRADFLLDRSIVRARLVKVPDDYRQRTKVKEMLRWETEERKQDFVDFCQKNGFEMREMAVWTDFSDLLAVLPASRNKSDEQVLRADGVQEYRDGDTWTYLLVTDRRVAGDALPLERAQEAIKRMLANRRRTELIRAYEDSIYMEAQKNKTIVINVR